LDEQKIIGVAAEAGLTSASFARCISEPGTDKAVARDIQEAERLQITSTPTTFVGTLIAVDQLKVSERLSGAAVYARLKALIEAALN
jgi:protein-disulfide isomerase